MFRTVRFESGQVVALGEQGIVRASIDSIVELNLPTLDPWQTYFEQLAILSPRASDCLLRIHTPDGLSATFSTLRMRPLLPEATAAQRPVRLQVQPAWALDPLTVEPSNVNCWERQLPEQASLDRIAPASRQTGSVLAAGRRPQTNLNVVGRPLVAGGKERRVGFGVAARSELIFPLPECAIGFHALVGLDRAAGDGGCAKGLVFQDEVKGTPLYQSDFLIGSAKLVDTGLLKLTDAKQLFLVADPAHVGRPAGADPLDIRDLLDWVSPSVALDPTGLQSAIISATPGGVPGWEDWQSPAVDLSALQIEQHWQAASQSVSDDSKQAADAEFEPSKREPGAGPRFVVEVTPRDAFFSLSRNISVDADARWLLVHVASRVQRQSDPPHVQVRFRGAAVAEFFVPIAQPSASQRPAAIPWERFQGEQGELEMIFFSPVGQSSLRFGSVELAAELPPGASAISGQPEGREDVSP